MDYSGAVHVPRPAWARICSLEISINIFVKSLGFSISVTAVPPRTHTQNTNSSMCNSQAERLLRRRPIGHRHAQSHSPPGPRHTHTHTDLMAAARRGWARHHPSHQAQGYHRRSERHHANHQCLLESLGATHHANQKPCGAGFAGSTRPSARKRQGHK